MTETAYYLRVSTEKQSVEHQREEIRDHLGDEQFYQAVEYVEIGSGAKDNREEFQQLITDIENGEINELIVWEMSRVSRKLSTTADFIDLCVEEGVRLETLNDFFPTIQPDSDIFSELMGKLTAWLVEFEREMIRERIQTGVDNAIAEGKWIGRTPYGFETDDDGFLRVKTHEFVQMQMALEDAILTDQSQNSLAEQYNVPQSSLNRIYNDEERRQLYLHGENEAFDQRVTDAIENVETDHEPELSSLKERVEQLESQVE
jgi:DNA invertase Pin-like site-specific DNA recombinase